MTVFLTTLHRRSFCPYSFQPLLHGRNSDHVRFDHAASGSGLRKRFRQIPRRKARQTVWAAFTS
ncbi:hypothetical protein KCP71_06420 [Salmonella enterica subsp. enterica]|nr:hypothetical protein KCP71_06420 [Salmonella enterica subsp. enterica]